MTDHREPNGRQTRERIDAYIDRAGLMRAGIKVVPLTGDASDRRYFRLIPTHGSSIVLALYASPFTFDTLPFVNVARLLRRIPLPVPDVLGHAADLGVLALEDLGDVTLQAHLGAAQPGEHAELYRQAVAYIERLQRRGDELASPEHLPYAVAFDVEKLTWELEFFVRHFMEAYRGAAIAPAQRDALREQWRALAGELASEPRVLCHRDYHSRNLMLHRGSLYIIDFQDARMGPDTYDLVSLLRDSYVDLAETSVEELIACFLALRAGPPPADAARPASAPPASEYRRRFDVMALQRNLKALGTFGYQTATRGNPVYIQYIPRTLNYARANLARHARFARLRELLAAHIEELR